MAEIQLYNTAARAKVAREPRETPGHPKMYVCGRTVYDRAHLGNARPAIVFDVLFRLLRHKYGAGNVTYVRNFTDVDDKIKAEATLVDLMITDGATNLVTIDDAAGQLVISPLGVAANISVANATVNVPDLFSGASAASIQINTAPMPIMVQGSLPPNIPFATDAIRLACGASSGFGWVSVGTPMP